MKGIEDRFYSKLLGNKTHKQLYQELKALSSKAYFITYRLNVGLLGSYQHTHLMHTKNRSEVVDQLIEWIDSDDETNNDGGIDFVISIVELTVGEEATYVGETVDINSFTADIVIIGHTAEFMKTQLDQLRYVTLGPDQYRRVQ
ncbi:MAG: hypothetical protein EOO61_06945 [Hymenobacter sp.]|nr:MAG: hypothetical protein EOO61_06945 [Hymenobacter sp.]